VPWPGGRRWIYDVHARPRRTVLRWNVLRWMAREDGATEDGATEVGATEDRATEDGATEDGAAVGWGRLRKNPQNTWDCGLAMGADFCLSTPARTRKCR
jgi:hypothetical protein